jgi:hypothetical protein
MILLLIPGTRREKRGKVWTISGGKEQKETSRIMEKDA